MSEGGSGTRPNQTVAVPGGDHHASQTKYFDTRNVVNGAGSRSIDYIYLVDLALIVPHASGE
jgi:hypothetical protein